jgi:hypothetical protein
MLGAILGNAFDRAISVTLYNWRIRAAGWAFDLLVSATDRTAGRYYHLTETLLWVPIYAFVAAAAQDRAFRWTFRHYFRVLIASISILFAFVAPFVAVVPLLGMLNLADATAASNMQLLLLAFGIPAFVLAVWWETCWSLAPVVILADDSAINAALNRSFVTVRRLFWPTLKFNLATTLAISAVSIGPVALANWVMAHLSVPANWLSHLPGQIGSLLFPLTFYAQIAGWLAYFKWWEWLKSRSERLERLRNES